MNLLFRAVVSVIVAVMYVVIWPIVIVMWCYSRFYLAAVWLTTRKDRQ